MENFDSKTAKIMIALIAIFTMIVACLPYAYRNMQNNPETEVNQSEDYSVPIDENYGQNRIKEQNNNDEITKDEEKQKNKKRISLNKLEEINEDESIPEIKTNEFEKADSLRAEQKYESAVYEYEKIAKSTDDYKVKAKCYEEIAITYAVMKRYGTALPYAEKAYNTEANVNRQFLLARLMYKTGHEDKAAEKIDEILKSDFEE
jgi:tetratricopeptide (TPR) repeat protein